MEYLLNTRNIRNICILAHVDHGKTTIADSLIASNGIISHKLAGKIRYLDNRPDEQERGITMKSSSIALKYHDSSGARFLINLVDTPGHVDFCGEVSTAVRLCDGALIVVDVVEGVCPQTKVAIEQAWKEGIEPILVLNKIDRLILEQKLDETAAHMRLKQLLEQVNAIVATLLTTELFEDVLNSKSHSTILKSNDHKDTTGQQIYDWASAIEDIEDDQYYFMPEKNNVIFASSIDDWAFTIGSFAQFISAKHRINREALQKTLWGDFYIDMKQKKILKCAQLKAKKTLFTSMILENIWKAYEFICSKHDKIRMRKICEALDIQLTYRDFEHTDCRNQIRLVMSKWLPLAQNLLDSVTKLIPSPKDLSDKRVERLLSSNLKGFQQLREETKKLKRAFLECSSEASATKVVCVSKMLPYKSKNMMSNKHKVVRPTNSEQSQAYVKSMCTTHTKHQDQVIKKLVEEKESSGNDEIIFIAFARVFSGRIERGDKLFVLGPRHDPTCIMPGFVETIDQSKQLEDLGLDEHVTVATVEKFYLLMGRDVEEIDYAPAGVLVGIEGLHKHLIRTATLSSDIYCPPFNDMHMPAAPILRVAIEPRNPIDTNALIRGLKLLNQADPCVEVRLQQTGEHVIIATGEVHLQHCIKDLTESYTDNIDLIVSQPIVPFRETVVLPPKTDMVNEAIDDTNKGWKRLSRRGVVEVMTPNKRCIMKVRASPLPEAVIDLLNSQAECLRVIARIITSKSGPGQTTLDELCDPTKKRINDFKHQLERAFADSRKERAEWRHLFQPDVVDRIWSFGPRYSGPNLLIASEEIAMNIDLWSKIGISNQPQRFDKDELEDYTDSFISGFQLAAQSGPLCEEPLMGVCFSILDWTFSEFEIDHPGANDSNEEINNRRLNEARDHFGPMSGQIISTVKECCRKAFQMQPQRLMSPMFSCSIQVTTEVLGKLYAVIGRRHGRILHGDMREGSQTFEIQAYIPVIESIDFVNEIRKQTSGMANPQLIFSHYEVVDVDPFWTPMTSEEYALFGEKADTENQARKYMNLVRRRKGLSVQEKTVEHGEKQRTIKRNK